jgi:UDPglucose--hexose-1-phosphate uridylyltransferase
VLGAALLHRALAALDARLGPATPLALWVRTAPRGAERFCWRIDLLPRLQAPGGFELGTGVHRNPVLPERAAAELRPLAAA